MVEIYQVSNEDIPSFKMKTMYLIKLLEVKFTKIK